MSKAERVATAIQIWVYCTVLFGLGLFCASLGIWVVAVLSTAGGALGTVAGTRVLLDE